MKEFYILSIEKGKKTPKMALELIKSILHELNLCKAQRAILRIHPTVTQLLTVLKEEQFVTIEHINHEIVQVKMTFTTINFIVLTKENVRRHEILYRATQLLPSIIGSMIMTATQGIMRHHKVIIRQLGGRILGIVY